MVVSATKLGGDSLWASAGRGTAVVCSFVMTLLLARALQPAEYGAYAVAVSTIIILAAVGSLGMDQVVVRFASARGGTSRPDLLRPVILVCLAISTGGGALTCAVLAIGGSHFFTSVVHVPAMIPVLWLVSIWVFFATIQRQLQESFRGISDIRLATVLGGVNSSGIVNSAVTCVAIIGLWALGVLDLRVALSVALGTSVLVVFCSLFVSRKLIFRGAMPLAARITNDANAFGVRKALYEGWPLWFAMLLDVLNAMGSVWLAAAFDTPQHVALFALAQKVVLLLMAPMQVMGAVLPPAIARLHAEHEMLSAGRLVRMAAGVALVPSLVVFLAVLVFGKSALAMIFGHYYAASFPFLVVIGVGQMVNLAGGAWQVVLPMTGRRMEMLAMIIFAIALQAGLGLYLGPRYGALGVAFAFALSMTIATVVGVCVVRLRLGTWTFAVFNRESVYVVSRYMRSTCKRALAHR